MPFFQTKLTVNEPGDEYEKEADAVAERVMRMPEGGSAPVFSHAGRELVQRKCEHCEEEEKLQRKKTEEEEVSVQTKPIADLPMQRKCAECEKEEKLQKKDEIHSASVDQGGEFLVQRKCAACNGEVMMKAAAGFDHSTTLRLGQPNHIQRECDECKISDSTSEEKEDDQEEKAEDKMYEKSSQIDLKREPEDPQGKREPIPDFENRLHREKERGTSLNGPVKTKMEDRFGSDFSHVRIHQGENAAELNAQIRAQAFTHGSHIYFNRNKFDEHSIAGQTLLAHELTHVVQQTGSNPIQPKIQRSEEKKLGNWAHYKIEKKLRESDNSLITEAPIPGGSAKGVDLNMVGFADLYKSTGNTVSGVRGKYVGSRTDLKDPAVKYESMPGAGGTGFQKLVADSNFRKIKAGSGYRYGPTLSAKKWFFSPGFPETFEVGEIKPLFPFEFPQSLLYHGSGFLQADHYVTGFKQFQKQVQKETNGAVSKSGKTMDIPVNKIPKEINYAKFDAEHLKDNDPQAIYLGNTHIYPRKPDSVKRLWLYKLKDGVYVYFLVPDPYESNEYPQNADKQLKKLDPILAKLRQKKPTIPNKIAPKREAGISITKVTGNDIQKKGWFEQAREWEADRKKWSQGKLPGQDKKPKSFLKSDAPGVEKKAKIDNKLHLTVGSKLEKESKEVKKIRFWNGWKGRVFGFLRFAFGTVMDKVIAAVDWIREKLKKFHGDSDKLLDGNSNPFKSWEKTAATVIIKIAVATFKEMIRQVYERFSNCINGIFSGLIDKYEEGIKEKAAEILPGITPVCCGIMVFKKKLEDEYKEHEKIINTFVNAIGEIKKWSQIFSEVETAVRIGVEIISCGTPPLLGCLWGLVAQVGIGEALDLIVDTDLFKDRIATPAANALMDTVVGDSMHNLVVTVLEMTPLKGYMIGIEPCQKKVRGKGGGNSKIGDFSNLDPNNPEIVKLRSKWQAENKDRMVKDLQQVFTKDGKPATEEDLNKLVKEMQDSGEKNEDLKKLIQGAKDKKTGKIDFNGSMENVKAGEVFDQETNKFTRDLLGKEEAKKELAKEYPTKDQLQKDVQSIDKKTIDTNIQFRKSGSNYICIVSTSQGAVVAAYFKKIDIQEKGEKKTYVIQFDQFYVMDPIESGDAIKIVFTNTDVKDDKGISNFTFLDKMDKGAPLDLNLPRGAQIIVK